MYESEPYNQGTFIYARDDTNVSMNQFGSMPLLEKNQLAAAAEAEFNQLPANFYLLDQGPDGSIQVQIGGGTPEAETTGSEPKEPQGMVWVGTGNSGQVLAIDPVSRDVTATVKFEGQPVDLAYGDGLLWVVLYDRNEIVSVDPLTDEVVSTYAAPNVIHSITYYEGKLWYTNPASIHFIDLETMEQGSFTTSYNPYDIEIFDGSFWITSPNKSAVVRFDLETFKAEAVITVEGDPRVIAARK